MRRLFGTAVIGLLAMATLSAQGPAQTPGWRFQFKAGQVLNYKVEHVTAVAETVNGTKEQTTSTLKLSKQWKVLNVDAAGVATLQLTLTAMRHEQVRPNGEKLLFDSANPGQSTPALKDAMSKFVGVPLAELRIDAVGRVIESKKEPIDRYDAEPPFQVVLPPTPVPVDGAWERPYTITLAPPQGTGEKYQAVERFECKEMNAYYARIALKTTVKNMPANQLDQVPLFQKMPEGEIIFNHHSGILHSANIHIIRDLKDHQGKDSSYHFESDYKEEFVPVTN